jgi:hypothetical protein
MLFVRGLRMAVEQVSEVDSLGEDAGHHLREPFGGDHDRKG